MNSRHVTGADKKPLPDRVDIIFYSYTEKQFYHGKFDLPYEKILDLFRRGYEENPEKPRYDGVMIGVAPGGAVSVWLKGYRTTEVFFGQAEKINISPSRGFNLTFDSTAESDKYVSDVLDDVLNEDELESLKNNGIPFGTWSRYRRLYKWTPAYKNFAPIKNGVPVNFLNGEKYFMPRDFNEEMANTPRPIPRTFGFAAPTASGRKLVFEITFDDFEMMDAFEKLGSKGEKLTIEIEPRAPQQATTIRLYNEKESIELKKARIE